MLDGTGRRLFDVFLQLSCTWENPSAISGRMVSTIAQGANEAGKTPAEARLRLHYLDGLRGLAAFYVVVHHAFLEVAAVPGWLPDRFCVATRWAWNGQFAVQIFIVLSGCCLMIPVARSGSLKGGLLAFAKRRARRILPPYYAALAFSLAIILLVPGMNALHGLRWDAALEATTWGAIGSHLLLLQDLRAVWITRIDPPMWTISQEWQIYFVFAFLLLPMWRRAGIVATVGVTFLLSVVLANLPRHDFAFAAPRFLFLFALGMAAATVNFPGSSAWLSRWQEKVRWAPMMIGCWTVYVVLWGFIPDQPHLPTTLFAVMAGLAVFCTLVFCTNSARHREHGNNLLIRICELDSVAVLGRFSYSLYLVHFAIPELFYPRAAPLAGVRLSCARHRDAHRLADYDDTGIRLSPRLRAAFHN